MVRTVGTSELVRRGLARRIPYDPRNPLGTPGTVFESRYHRPGSHRHGSVHLNRLRRLGERMDRRITARRRGLANYRPATNKNFVSNSVVAIPFNEPVNLQVVPAGYRDKRERLNQLPVAVPVGPSALFERVKNEGPETNLFLPWEFHAPELQRRRSRSRSRRRRAKGRSRSRSEPRRPRSH